MYLGDDKRFGCPRTNIQCGGVPLLQRAVLNMVEGARFGDDATLQILVLGMEGHPFKTEDEMILLG